MRIGFAKRQSHNSLWLNQQGVYSRFHCPKWVINA